MTFEEWLFNEQGLTATWNVKRNCYTEFHAHLAYKAWLASRKAALEEAALACQKHTPKDSTVAGIITRAKCAEAVLALKERA